MMRNAPAGWSALRRDTHRNSSSRGGSSTYSTSGSRPARVCRWANCNLQLSCNYERSTWDSVTHGASRLSAAAAARRPDWTLLAVRISPCLSYRACFPGGSLPETNWCAAGITMIGTTNGNSSSPSQSQSVFPW